MEKALRYDVFVACMAAYIHGVPVESLPPMTGEDWKALYKLAKRQSLSGALFAAVNTLPMPPAAKEHLQRDGFWMLAAYEAQILCVKDIAKAMRQASVLHVFFKGAVIREYYRNPAMRSMGDIDMVVKAEDAPRAHEAMTAAGFERVECAGDVWVYERDKRLVEMHTSMHQFDVNEQSAVAYETFWEDVRLESGTTYRLSDEAEAVHVIAHLAGHFCGGGCGLRQLMDVAILCERFSNEAFWDDVMRRLAALGLTDFTGHLLYLCERWFGVWVPQTFVKPLAADQTTSMRDRLLDEGTFGADEHTMLASMRRERRLQKRGGTVGHGLRWVFPAPSYVSSRYRYAKRVPLLLPVAYIHRWIDGVTKNRRIHKGRVRYAKEQQHRLEAELVFFESIGL